MRKLFIQSLVFIWAVISFSACEQQQMNELDTLTDNEEIITFKYNEKVYTSKYQVLNNRIICADKTVQDLLNKLEKNPQLATLVHTDNSIEYFDSYEKLTEYLDQYSFTPNITTKAAGSASCTIKLYADANYKGTNRSYQFSVPSTQTGASYSDLSTIGLLNAISSLKINTNYYSAMPYDARVSLWDQRNFTGYSITFQTQRNTSNPVNISNLANHHRGPLVTTSTWDNAAQSAKIGF